MASITLESIHAELKKPWLILRTERGFLACGHINIAVCDKNGEACAVIAGVHSYDDILSAHVCAISAAAGALGVKVGDQGSAALAKMSQGH